VKSDFDVVCTKVNLLIIIYILGEAVMAIADRCKEAGAYSLVITQKAKEGQEKDNSVSPEWGHNFLETTFEQAVVYSCNFVNWILGNRKKWNLCEVEIISATLKFRGADDRDITEDVKQALM